MNFCFAPDSDSQRAHLRLRESVKYIRADQQPVECVSEYRCTPRFGEAHVEAPRLHNLTRRCQAACCGQHADGEPVASTRTDIYLAHALASASSAVDGQILPDSHRLGPLATIDGGDLRFEIGDDVRREGADVQKDHYHHHDIL